MHIRLGQTRAFCRRRSPTGGSNACWVGPNGRGANAGTRRCTQLDPIGLGGGLNLYGFAGGDPVNFSDPFGLFDVKVQGEQSQKVVDYQRANSPTSARPYEELDSDRTITVRVVDGSSSQYDPSSSTVSFSVGDVNYGNRLRMAAADGNPAWIFTAASMMAHEFAHAGAAKGKLPEQCKTDEATACAIKYENQVRSDLPPAGRGGERKSYSPTRMP